MNIHEELMQLINGMTGRIINLEAENHATRHALTATRNELTATRNELTVKVDNYE